MIKETASGVIIQARVKAGSGSFSIRMEKDGITIHTKSPAEGNKANLEIIKNLSKLFRRDVKISRGLQSKHKEIFVAGASPAEVEMLISKK